MITKLRFCLRILCFSFLPVLGFAQLPVQEISVETAPISDNEVVKPHWISPIAACEGFKNISISGHAGSKILTYKNDNLKTKMFSKSLVTSNLNYSQVPDFRTARFDEPVVFAGADESICENQAINLIGEAQNYSSVVWSGGDGIFTSPGNLVTDYIPGFGDIAAGTAELCLTAEPIDPNTVAAIDCLVLTIQVLQTVYAGNDVTICETQACPTNPVIENCSQTFWISTGDGYFDDETLGETNYYPGTADYSNGQVDLWLWSVGNYPCSMLLADYFIIYIDKMPTVTAGNDTMICENDLLQLTGVAENYSNILWTSTGNGTFTNTTILSPVYTPGTADIGAGTVELYLMATKTGVCDFAIVTDSLQLTIIAKPAIYNLNPERILDCSDYDLVNQVFLPLLIDPVIENESSVFWTTTGDGIFDDPTVENPIYHPGIHDIWNGGFGLSVIANGLGGCNFTAQAGINIIVPTQIIPIETGEWCGISSFIEKSGSTVPEVMAPVNDELIELIKLYKGTSLYYWPDLDPPVNQIGNWQPIGYKANFSAPCCLPIYGKPLKDQSFVVEGIVSHLPVLTNVLVIIEDLLGTNANDVSLIYDWSNGKFWSNEASDLITLMPGKSYLLVKKDSAPDFTVLFPAYDPSYVNKDIERKDVFFVGNTPWNEVLNTSQPHIILFGEGSMNELQAGDVIGAFNGEGLCVGVTGFESRDNLNKLIVMGNDAITERNDGYASGENMRFKVYRPGTGATYEIAFTYDPGLTSYDGKFAVNGFSRVIKSTMMITTINSPTVNTSIKIFPNPANEIINVVSDFDISRIKLINLTGQSMIDYTTTGATISFDVSKYVSGLYFLRIETTDDEVITKRIVIE